MTPKSRVLREALLRASAALEGVAKAVDGIADLEARIAILEARLGPQQGNKSGGRPFKGGLNKITKKRADGTIVTYWYAYKGGPRLSAEQVEFVRNNNGAEKHDKPA